MGEEEGLEREHVTENTLRTALTKLFRRGEERRAVECEVDLHVGRVPE